MNGYDVYKQACVLLGYSSDDGSVVLADSLMKRAEPVINQIIDDLGGNRIESLNSTIDLDVKRLDALCTGAAMLLAYTECEATKGAFFAELYYAKRSRALAGSKTKTDVLPTDNGVGK